MRIQSLALAALQAGDLITTHAGLARTAQEANPIGLAFLAHGFPALVLAKTIGTLAILGMAWWLSRSQPSQARITLQVCCSLMLAVVAWNAWMLQLH